VGVLNAPGPSVALLGPSRSLAYPAAGARWAHKGRPQRALWKAFAAFRVPLWTFLAQRRRARDSNPQPVSRHLISREMPKCLLTGQKRDSEVGVGTCVGTSRTDTNNKSLRALTLSRRGVPATVLALGQPRPLSLVALSPYAT
jgi:hypothetical protein